MGNPLPPIAGPNPYANRPQGAAPVMPNSLKTPGGLVLNFFGSNFTGSNEGTAVPVANTPAAEPVAPYWPAQSAYPVAANQSAIGNSAPALNPAASAIDNGPKLLGASTATSNAPVDPSKLTPQEQLNALYKDFNAAQQEQEKALKAVQDAEAARNRYLALGNSIRNLNAPKTSEPVNPANQAGTNQTGNPTPAEPMANSMPVQAAQPAPAAAAIQPSTAEGAAPLSGNAGQNAALNSALNANQNDGQNNALPPNLLPAATAEPAAPVAGQPPTGVNTSNLSPDQAALANQALAQSGLTPDGAPNAAPVAGAPATPEAPATANPAATATTPLAPTEQPATAGQTGATTGATPAADAIATTPTAVISGATPDTLNSLIFTPEELVQFKKLNPREQVDWITQRNLQTKADAIGEIAIQSGLPNGNKFPQETYDRLEAIAKLDTKDIRGAAGQDLEYFRKTGLWTLGLLIGAQNSGKPINSIPAVALAESIARDPKETKGIRVAAAQSLQAMNRGNDPAMQQILNRISSNDKSILKPWSWVRANTPADVKQIVQSARKNIPIQVNQPPSGISAGAPAVEPATTSNPAATSVMPSAPGAVIA
jgi:hypothetical protein